MEALKAACVKKSFKGFKELAPGEYIVRNFQLASSKYGPRVRIDLDDFYMYLPERFATALTPSRIEELNKAPKIMVFSGKDPLNKERLLLEFHDVEVFTKSVFSGLNTNDLLTTTDLLAAETSIQNLQQQVSTQQNLQQQVSTQQIVQQPNIVQPSQLNQSYFIPPQ